MNQQTKDRLATASVRAATCAALLFVGDTFLEMAFDTPPHTLSTSSDAIAECVFQLLIGAGATITAVIHGAKAIEGLVSKS